MEAQSLCYSGLNGISIEIIVQKQLTKICWQLIALPSTPDFSGKVGLNLALGLVTSYCSHQAACLRPECFWLE